MLTREGYDVRGFENGLSAIEALARLGQPGTGLDVDIVLTDFRLNDITGLEVLKAVKSLDASTQVVLMTAYADVKLAVKGLKSGAVDFVTKPWDNHELIRSLKDAIDANTEIIPLEKMEEEHVRKVVDKCHGNISKAAELLEISRQRLYNKLKK